MSYLFVWMERLLWSVDWVFNLEGWTLNKNNLKTGELNIHVFSRDEPIMWVSSHSNRLIRPSWSLYGVQCGARRVKYRWSHPAV